MARTPASTLPVAPTRQVAGAAVRARAMAPARRSRSVEFYSVGIKVAKVDPMSTFTDKFLPGR